MDVAIEVLRSATNCQQRIDDVNKTLATDGNSSEIKNVISRGFTRKRSSTFGTLHVRLNSQTEKSYYVVALVEHTVLDSNSWPPSP